MLKQVALKWRRHLKGYLNSRLGRATEPYDAQRFYDEVVFVDGVSDRGTVGRQRDELSALYHYSSVELTILKHLSELEFHPTGKAICDLGSGAGHWIDFYRTLGARSAVGIDIAKQCAEHLDRKYAADPEITIKCGPAAEHLADHHGEFDIVNAIGVMFHIVDDSEWARTISLVHDALAPGGIFVVGGHFGWFDGLNVLTDGEGHVSKRLRSAGRWRKELRRAGFQRIAIHRNRAWLDHRDRFPETNVLVAGR